MIAYSCSPKTWNFCWYANWGGHVRHDHDLLPDAVTTLRIVSAIRTAVLDKKARTHYIPAVAQVSESVVAHHAEAAAHIL
jgi:hypothetical protein